jgi:hypothetical protein
MKENELYLDLKAAQKRVTDLEKELAAVTARLKFEQNQLFEVKRELVLALGQQYVPLSQARAHDLYVLSWYECKEQADEIKRLQAALKDQYAIDKVILN